MEFINHTPFDALAFEGITPARRSFHVLVAKQTLEFDASGALTLSDDQAPLAVVDTFRGEPNRSSVIAESDFCHYKPKCDVLVVGDACAPGGVPVAKFPIRLRVQRAGGAATNDAGPAGDVLVNKVLVMTGPRVFRKQDDAWVLSPPAPIDRLPLGYEYAQGGENVIADPDNAVPVFHACDERNPVGIGYADAEWSKRTDREEIAAPQVETTKAPLDRFGNDLPPLGLGAISKAWLPRRTLLGTVDDAFIAGDAPLPHDFQSAYWNAAPPDQQTPHLAGDEVITLNNLTPEGEVRLALPGDTIYALVCHEDGDVNAPSLKIDTVLIDTVARRVNLTWRAVLAKEADRPLRVVELRYRDGETDRALKAGIVARLEALAAEAAAGEGPGSPGLLEPFSA